MRSTLTMRAGGRAARVEVQEREANRSALVKIVDEDGMVMGAVEVIVRAAGHAEVRTRDYWAETAEGPFVRLAEARAKQLRRNGIEPATFDGMGNGKLKVRVPA